MKKVYISGPMRGQPHWNRAAFTKAHIVWSREGWQVFNPHVLAEAMGYTIGEEVPPGPEHRDHLTHVIRCDVAHIQTCDALALLAGWEYSAGCTVEVAMAQFLGLPLYDALEPGRKLDIPKLPWRWLH